MVYTRAQQLNAARVIAESIYRNRSAITSGYKRLRQMSTPRARRAVRRRLISPISPTRPPTPYRRRTTTSLIGDDVGTDTTKKNLKVCAIGNRATKTLYSENLLNIDQTSTGVEINERLRQIANIRGFQFDFEVASTQNSKAYYFNLAVVSPKLCGQQQLVDSGSQTTFPNFFRSYNNERSIDFGDAALSSLEIHKRPINTDLFHVLTHKRYTLGPQQPGDSATVHQTLTPSVITEQFYLKFDRQVRYQTNQGNVPENANLFLVYWYTEVGGTPSTTIQPLIAQQNTCVIAFFKDPE